MPAAVVAVCTRSAMPFPASVMRECRSLTFSDKTSFMILPVITVDLIPLSKQTSREQTSFHSHLVLGLLGRGRRRHVSGGRRRRGCRLLGRRFAAEKTEISSGIQKSAQSDDDHQGADNKV